MMKYKIDDIYDNDIYNEYAKLNCMFNHNYDIIF